MYSLSSVGVLRTQFPMYSRRLPAQGACPVTTTTAVSIVTRSSAPPQPLISGPSSPVAVLTRRSSRWLWRKPRPASSTPASVRMKICIRKLTPRFFIMAAHELNWGNYILCRVGAFDEGGDASRLFGCVS